LLVENEENAHNIETKYLISTMNFYGGNVVKRDVFIRSVYAGMLSAIIYTLVELVLINLGLQHASVWRAAAGMYLPFDQVATPLGTLIGTIGHLTVGGLWGISFYILLLFIGLDRSVYKGVLFGFCIWLFSAIMMRWGVTSYVYFDSSEQLGALIGTLTFGLSLGFLVPRMALAEVSESSAIIKGFLATKIAQPAYKPTQNKDEEK
jgi:hypothetical protein